MSNLRDKLQRLAPLPGSRVSVSPPDPHLARDSHLAPDLDLAPHLDRILVPDAASPLPAERTARLSALRAQMARIGEKIARAPAPVRVPAYAVPAPHTDDDALSARAHAFALASSLIPGELVEGPLGALRLVRRELDPDHRHGVIPVVSALNAAAADVALLALDPTLAEVDLSRALYIDTETTGLAGGAGTLPFLIGMAWFEGERLCVEQLLLERPGAESPMLARLAQRIAQASLVVSFNGKSFDWPLLRTRFVLTRVPAPKLPPHLDLLHCARRVYKRRLGSVRLVHLEEQVLGFTRVDDVAGELIPDTYLGFLRGQVPAGALRPIVEHNQHDLIALAALLGEIARRFRQAEPAQDARDQLGFAGVAARTRSEDGAERARLFAQGAAEADLRGELAFEAHHLSAELCLREGDVAGAERALLSALEAAAPRGQSAARTHIALAKLYEHRLKRLAAALEHARAGADHEGEEASARRVARLARKLTSSTLPLVSPAPEIRD